MPKGTATCNNILNLYYRAEAIANIADNAAASPITQIKMRLATASYGPSSTGSSNEATYTNYAAQDVPRSGSGWTAASGGATSNAARTRVVWRECAAHQAVRMQPRLCATSTTGARAASTASSSCTVQSPRNGRTQSCCCTRV